MNIKTIKINQEYFFNLLSQGKIEKVLVKHKEVVSVWLKREYSNSNIINLPNFQFEIGDLQLFQNKFYYYKQIYHLNTILDFKNEPSYNFFKFLIDYSVILTIITLFWFFLLKRRVYNNGTGVNHIFNIGKSRAKLFSEHNNIKITFNDLAGLEGAKEEVQEIVEFLKKTYKYTKLGGKIPKGVLLIGPPGTGKTLLAKAVAGEAKVPFFSLSGSDFVEMFVGVGASRVRDLFQQAKDKSPSIIFIDEIDAIGRMRGQNNIVGANDERENTLNQLLTEMDGFRTNTNVIVIGATNRYDILDYALLRPGRFDRTIYVDLPELIERKEIFNVHIKKLKLSNNVDIDFLARQTPGFSGADIANICNESALIATRRNKLNIEQQDFLDALDRIIGGFEKKNKIIKPNEKKRVAYHEAGHATISWLVEYAAPLVKVTLVPRGRTLGAAWYVPDERQLTTIEQMQDEICALLGGRASEQVIFGNISTGALNDLERVTKYAKSMVAIFGFNKRIGNISYYDETEKDELTFIKPYSEYTARIIDEEISKIIDDQYRRACKILTDNKNKLSKLAIKLLEEEVIFRCHLEEIFGKRIFND